MPPRSDPASAWQREWRVFRRARGDVAWADDDADVSIVVRQYGYSTIEFYRRFENGELGDDADMLMWAGLYHLYLTSLPVRQFMQRESATA